MPNSQSGRGGVRRNAFRSCLLLAASFSTLVTATSALATSTSYQYDAQGRVVLVTYSDGTSIGYSYDSAGNRFQQVINGDHAPVAVADSITTPYQTAKTFDPRANDTDADGDALTITGTSSASHGTVTFTGTSVTYTPNSGYYGADSFTYTISDGRGGASTATVSMTVGNPPAPSVATASLSVAYNTAGSVGLSAIGVYTALAVSTNPGHGSASISGTTATYTPTAGYYGADSFTYTATGPGGTSSPATVSVTVATPAAPSVGAGSLSTGYNTAGSFALSPNGVYSSLAVSTNPGHGSVSISGTTATYTPTAGYYGADSFAYTATGPGGTSAPATVNVAVATPAAPTVGTASLSTAYNTAGSVGLSPSGVYSLLSVSTNPGHGSASISGTTATYTPTAGYYGTDSFAYTATGPGGTSSPATVSVTVANPSAPTAVAGAISSTYNGSGSTTLAPTGVWSTLNIAGNPAHGSASISGTTATYTPTAGYYGADSFTYTATGPGGTSASATVSVTVGNPPAPSVSNISLTTGYNTPGSLSVTPSGVYTSINIPMGPAHGSVTSSGTTVTYTPSAGYYGADSFTYTATGPGGTSSPATISVTVGNPAAPTVGNGALTVAYNTAGSVGLSPSGVYNSLAVAANPGHGSVSISGTTATYTPTSGYSGADSFTYNATGPGGTSSPATVSVTVQPPAITTINITTSVVNLRVLANNAGYTGSASAIYQFVVPSGNTIYGASGGGAAITTGTWPAGVSLSLVVSGNVYGGGGNGGNGTCTSTLATVGSNGGDAVYVQAPMTITVNSGGGIASGGGGGGGASVYGVGNGHGGGGGSCGAGGGGGFPNGAGGAGSTPPSNFSASATTSGSPGTTAGGGAGGTGGLPGGTGGGAGAAGLPGATGNGNAGGNGGTAGYSIRKNGNSVTVTNSGTITGTQG